MPLLSRRQARLLYDRFGARQDARPFYELPAERELLARARFEEARNIIEFGCGPGRLAARLLTHHLDPDARYLGVDLSSTMVGLARVRLRPWAGRARVLLSDGSMVVPGGLSGCDRFLSCYVMDLLSEVDIRSLLTEACHLLRPDGLLCLIGLTPGESPASRLVSGLWGMVHAVAPARLGGCRPIRLGPYLEQGGWLPESRTVRTRFGISSEVVVARPPTHRTHCWGRSAPP